MSDWENEVLGGFLPLPRFNQICHSSMQYYTKTPKLEMSKMKPVQKHPETTKSTNNPSEQVWYWKYILTNLIT